MNHPTVDTPRRFLLDLKKLLGLHQAFGIADYPRSSGLEHFLLSPSPSPPNLASPVSKAPPIVPQPRPCPDLPTTCPAATGAGQTLAEIEADLGHCQHCPSVKTNPRRVFGAGNPKAALFIVGDFPSPEDEVAGTPFSGAAGELLAKMLGAIGLSLADVYLSTVVKCQPTGNEDPTPEQIKTCLPYLFRQIACISPKVICTMGQLAAQALLQTKTPLVRLRGNFHDCQGTPLMPTFHPAFLLRHQEMKKATWIDLQLLQAKLGLVKTAS